MNDRFNYYWRLTATGICFAAFGIGGLLLTTLIFPALRLTPRHLRTQRARWLIHQAFRIFMGMMRVLGVLRIEVIGGKALHKCRNTLVLANHPSLIDVVAIISLMPTANCVVKQALWKNPFIGGVVRAASYISNSDPETLIDACAKDLATGNPLIIFPEGTRTEPGKPLHFLRGASYVALRSETPILPVLIDCTPSTLTKREKWYQIPRRPAHLRIEVLDPVPLSRWVSPEETPTVAARKLTAGLEAYFTQELASNGCTARTHA